MTRYEQTMYERDLPGIRQSLENIANSLQKIERIISDPGDEVEHITEYAVSQADIGLPDDYNMD